MSETISRRFSRNASVLKVLAISAIIVGHFAAESPGMHPVMNHWWVISAVGLIVFSYTSALFTGMKYGPGFDLKAFWMQKLRRLGIPFTIINLLLLVLFLAEGREGVVSVQTFASWLGLRGFWTWFGAGQVGPYGAGLWFLTLLILFYLAYPLLERVNRSRTVSNGFTAISLLVLLVLDRTVPMGHTLWITAAGFLLGVRDARHGRPFSMNAAMSVLLVTAVCMVSLRFFLNISMLSGLLMLIAARTLVDLARYLNVHWLAYDLLLPLSPCILGMYIAHTYLFIHPTGLFVFDFVASGALILAFAFVASLLAGLALQRGSDGAQPKTVQP
ncbi:acyltransferase family protein [Salidesulfovibrio brasiliensis]|uniref:acyltransferase family protein n=1 Tax=Salidesulfovibrio brasiliensis TaxID=221711 RepID=UPI0006D0A94E|nr:acyltransferase family protein [Salidesulfovibrio brasiliensis]